MSLRKAIDAKCKECIYDPIGGPGSWRNQVGNCTAYSCPLYDVRPTPYASSSKGESLILARENGQIGALNDRLGGAS